MSTEAFPVKTEFYFRPYIAQLDVGDDELTKVLLALPKNI